MLFLRDVGGWNARGGQVREGLLFRSAQLEDLHGEDEVAFARLGIRSVYDLRTPDECEQRPDQVPVGVEYIAIDVLRDIPGGGPAQLMSVMADPKAAQMVFGNRHIVARFEQGFRSIVNLPSALSGYHQLFSDFADPARAPAVLHCTTGKDRTGWAVAALLLLLGVTEDDVYADYLITNKQLMPALQPIVDKFVALGGDADLLAPVLGVQGEYLDVAVDEMRQRYGSIERYFAEGLQLDAHTVEQLRKIFVEQG